MKAGERVQVGSGYSTALPSFDFETYSEAGCIWNPQTEKWEAPPGIDSTRRGLKCCGLRAYVEHPTFAILCVSWDLRDGVGVRTADITRRQRPESLLAHVARGGLLKAFNAQFEFEAWNAAVAGGLNWPALRREQLICTQAEAKIYSMPPSLAEAGNVLRVNARKDSAGDRLIKLFTMPRNPTKAIPSLRLQPEQAPEDWNAFIGYNRQDVCAETAVSDAIPDLSPTERRIYLADQAINARGIAVDRESLASCMSIIEHAARKYTVQIATITRGAVQRPSEVAKLLAWCGSRGVHAESLDAESLDEVLARPDIPDDVRRALQIRALMASASVKKLYAINAQLCRDGRLRYLYNYAASKTHRWGGVGPQPMNLPKGSLKSMAEVEAALATINTRSLDAVELDHGDALEAVSSCLRALLWAEPGNLLVCSDYSAIEGVVAAAITGCEWRLDVFRTHGLIYEASASRISGVPLQAFIDHKQRTGQHHPLRNKLGKFAELASGFGGWVPAWKNFGADEHMTDDEIKNGVLGWREASPEFPAMWNGLQDSIIRAIQNPGRCFGYGPVSYERRDDALYCCVPGGGIMTYHRPRLAPSQREFARPGELSISYEGWNTNPKAGGYGWQRMYLYGGKAFENVVQKVARDIQANALVNCDDAGLPIVLHTHDELAAEVVEARANVAELEACMNALPSWCADWPVRAKGGWTGRRYRKD